MGPAVSSTPRRQKWRWFILCAGRKDQCLPVTNVTLLFRIGRTHFYDISTKSLITWITHALQPERADPSLLFFPPQHGTSTQSSSTAQWLTDTISDICGLQKWKRPSDFCLISSCVTLSRDGRDDLANHVTYLSLSKHKDWRYWALPVWLEILKSCEHKNSAIKNKIKIAKHHPVVFRLILMPLHLPTLASGSD